VVVDVDVDLLVFVLNVLEAELLEEVGEVDVVPDVVVTVAPSIGHHTPPQIRACPGASHLPWFFWQKSRSINVVLSSQEVPSKQPKVASSSSSSSSSSLVNV